MQSTARHLVPTMSDLDHGTTGTRPTLLDIFARDLIPVGPNMSNASTAPKETDFDDQ